MNGEMSRLSAIGVTADNVGFWRVLSAYGCGPKRQAVARSFQFGRASAPIAPHTVQTMRGPKDGTVTSSAKAPASNTAW
jgi:hypothetical protein